MEMGIRGIREEGEVEDEEKKEGWFEERKEEKEEK